MGQVCLQKHGIEKEPWKGSCSQGYVPGLPGTREGKFPGKEKRWKFAKQAGFIYFSQGYGRACEARSLVRGYTGLLVDEDFDRQWSKRLLLNR